MGVRVGDTVACRGVRGTVISTGWTTSVGYALQLERGALPRLIGFAAGGSVAYCVDAAGWLFTASIGWKHYDPSLSIRRGVVVP